MSIKKGKENKPGNDGLGLLAPAHEQIDLCGLFIEMGLERSGRVNEGNRGVLVAAVLIVSGTEIVCVGEGFVGVEDDEAGSADAGVGEVCAEAGLEDGENCVVAGVDGGLGGGSDEVDEVSARHGLRRHGERETECD